MPLGRGDADRGLDLFWEFHREAESEEERAAYSEAIASLHSYLTDLLPASQPSLRARSKEGFVDVTPRHETPVTSVELYCGRGEKLGVSIDCVSVGKLGNCSDVSPFVVSLVKPGSAADREGSLRRGDQLVEIDGRPLAHVSLERARWLLDSAGRRGVVKLSTVPLGLIDGMKHSVSREDILSSLSLSSETSPTHPDRVRGAQPRKWRWKLGRGTERTALNQLQPKTDAGPSVTAFGERQSEKGGTFSREEEVGGGEEGAGSRMSLTSSVGGGQISRGNSSRNFQRRKVRKMHIMKGTCGLGLRIIGGKGSKHGNIGIFIRDIEANGAAHSDGRLKPGDEILMVDGKSLVGLTHSEAVGVLKTTQQLVQLVVATEVSGDQSITSSMTSIPDWARNSVSLGPPPVFSSSSPQSLSPLSTGFAEGGAEFVSPEFGPSPHRLAFGGFSPGGEILEMTGLGHVAKCELSAGEGVRETEFTSSGLELPAKKAQRLGHGANDKGYTEGDEVVGGALGEREEVDVVLEKKEEQTLGFTVCRGNDAIDGIFVRAVDPTGVAGREGLLRVGDQLLEANGRSLTGLTHKQSASVIRGLKAGSVVLRVSRQVTPPPSAKADSETESSSTEMETSLTASQGLRGEPDEDLGPPPMEPPPQPPGDSESDTEREPSPSPPPTPPASGPPPRGGESWEPPPPPVSPLPMRFSKDQDQTQTQLSDGGGVEITSHDHPKMPVDMVNEAQPPQKGPANQGLTEMEDSAASDTESEDSIATGRKVVKQIISSSATDSSDIAIGGTLTVTGLSGFTSPAEKENKNASEGESDNAIGLPPAGDDSTVKEKELEEREGEPPLGFKKLVLQMKKRVKSGLGVTIVQSMGKTRGLYMVRRIMAGGVAARDKRIKPGDRLVAINGKSLRNLSHSEVLQAINEAPKELQLEIWRDPEFELDATSSIYSIGSRSSILSDEDTEDSTPKRNSLERIFSRDGARGARASPQIARYSASIADHVLSPGRPSPGMPKRWSAVILSPNIGPAGELLSSLSPPHTSPTHTFNTPINPLPSPTTVTPSPVPPSLSPSPEPFVADLPPQPLPSFPPPNLPELSDSDGSQTPPLPPLPTSHPPILSGEHAQPLPNTSREEESVFETREVERPKSLGPVPKGVRLEHGPFEIEITKGMFGLGLSVGMGTVGMIIVQSLTSRSPIKKDGNIRVGDQLLSINDESLIGVDVETAESVIKALSRGVVRFVAMAAPRDVTGRGLKSSPHHPTLPSSPPPPPPASPLPEIIDEPGIITAQLQHFSGVPLGLIVEGGSESPLKYIFVKSIEMGSPASKCGQFVKGDQLVMVGRECLIGKSLQEAQQVLDQAPEIVEVVSQRKESAKQSPPLALKSETERGKREMESEKEDEVQEDTEKERQFTESLPPPQRQLESSWPKFRRSTSQSDVWMTEQSSGGSTSLGYATTTTNLSASLNITRPGATRSKMSSVENLRDSTDLGDSGSFHHPGSLQGPNYYLEQPPAKPAEELIVVGLCREATHKLGLAIVGGADNPRLPEVHVKKVIPDGLVFKDGRIKRGDRIMSVNEQPLTGLTNKEALQLLKESGDSVRLEVARKLGQRSQAPSPLHSVLQSRQSSGENTNEPPSPVIGFPRQRSSAPHTPPSIHAPRNTLRSRSRRVSLSQEDEEDPLGPALRSKPATMPRKLKSTEGVKIVELQKGPTGLGMNLKGGTDENLPIIVREVFPGGVAHKSGKIFPGDVIIEVNNDSFEALTHREALQRLKSYPQGKISLLVRDRMATLPRKTIPEHN